MSGNKVTRIRAIPEPVEYRGRQRLLNGWNTGAVCTYLLERKYGEQYISISELAVFVHARDSETNRNKVRKNVRIARRWLDARDEFLISLHGVNRRTTALKVANLANEQEMRLAREMFHHLVARGEILTEDIKRWEARLFLTTLESAQQPEQNSQTG